MSKSKSESKIPTNMIEADAVAEKLKKQGCPLSGAEIEDLAMCGLLPHFVWVVPVRDGKKFVTEEKGPLFQITHVKEWMLEAGYFQIKEGEPTGEKGRNLDQRVSDLEKKITELTEKLRRKGIEA